MATDTRPIGMRVPEALVDDARIQAGLPPYTTISEVVRFALATIAKRPDPHAEMLLRADPKPRAGAAA
jgi:Arc/MetJ-type ribon-helix-helix transcriptional regulator